MSDASDTIRRLEAELAETRLRLEEAQWAHGASVRVWRQTERDLDSARSELEQKQLDFNAESERADDLRSERDNAARNERIRIADMVEALAARYRASGCDRASYVALLSLAAELRTGGV